MNASVHGINETDVSTAPTFSEIAGQLRDCLISSVVCHHTSFNRTAIYAAHERHNVTIPEIEWLDTARVVRRTWPDRSRSGYALDSVATMLGIKINHHDAEEDARAAGEMLLHAIGESGLSVTKWLVRVKRPITLSGSSTSEHHTRDGNPEGPLFGETAIVTGTLAMRHRDEAADMAAEAGCDVRDNVTKSTTLLIVGDPDVRKLAGHKKTSKHRKSEANIKKGLSTRILRENDFIMLLETAKIGT